MSCLIITYSRTAFRRTLTTLNIKVFLIIIPWRIEIEDHTKMFRSKQNIPWYIFPEHPAKVKLYKVALHEHLRSFRRYIVEAADTDESFNSFNCLFLEITDLLEPFRTFQCKWGKNPKWMNELQNLKTSKDLAHCIWKKTRKRFIWKTLNCCAKNLKTRVGKNKRRF